MRKCSDCGFEFDDDKSFCPSCGKYMPKIKNPYTIADCSPDNDVIEQERPQRGALCFRCFCFPFLSSALFI